MVSDNKRIMRLAAIVRTIIMRESWLRKTRNDVSVLFRACCAFRGPLILTGPTQRRDYGRARKHGVHAEILVVKKACSVAGWSGCSKSTGGFAPSLAANNLLLV